MDRWQQDITKKELKVGEIYLFSLIDKIDGKIPVAKKRRYRLLGKYPHIAEFEDMRTGIHRSFQYQDISKMLRGEAV